MRSWILGLALASTSAGGLLAQSGLRVPGSAPASPASPASPARNRMTLLYDGWVQGMLRPPLGGGRSRAASLVAALRAEHPDLVLVSSGNVLGPSATSEIDGGAAVVRLMNLSGYRVAGVGPHDLFKGSGNLLERADEMEFPLVWSNLRRDGLSDPGWDRVRTHAVVEQGGARLGVLSVISPELVRDWPGWDARLAVTDPVAALEESRELLGEVDRVVVLSSMNFQENSALLTKLPWVDLVVAQQLGTSDPWDYSTFQVERSDGRKILFTSCYGTTMGLVEVGDREGGGMAAPARLLTVGDDLPEDPEAAEIVAALEIEAEAIAGATLTVLSPEERTDFARTLLEALRIELSAEVAMLHRGAVKTGEPAEHLTHAGVRAAFPFPDRAALVPVEGSRLRKLWARRDEPIINQKGLVFVGLSEVEGRLMVNGRPVRDQDRYRVATVEYLALGALGLLPRTPGAVRDREFVAVVADHFARTGGVSRELGKRPALARAAGSRPVHRFKTRFDASVTRLQFGGAAAAYQFPDPSALFTSSDIPGLVGQASTITNLGLEHEHTIDRPERDLTLRLNVNYTKFNDFRMVDRSTLLLRHEGKDRLGRPRTFAELGMFGTLIDPDLPGRDRPLFGKLVAGKAWTLGDSTKLLVGAGHIVRFSSPGDPGDTGLNLGFEHRRKLTKGVEFSSTVDHFLGVGGDHVRSLDWANTLRTELGGGLSAVIKNTRYFWRDDSVARTAERDELFVGLGFGRGARRY